MSATAALSVEHVYAGYDRLEVLHDVGLEVGEHQIVVLLGANGAGKTTLLRTIAGVIRPRQGAIRLFGRPIHGRPAHEVTRAGVGHVPSGRELFPNLSMADNLALGASPGPSAGRRCWSRCSNSSPSSGCGCTSGRGADPVASSRCWRSEGR